MDEFLLFHILAFGVLDFSHSNSIWWLSHCFSLQFLKWYLMFSIFHVSLPSPVYFFIGEVSVQIFTLLCNWVASLLLNFKSPTIQLFRRKHKWILLLPKCGEVFNHDSIKEKILYYTNKILCKKKTHNMSVVKKQHHTKWKELRMMPATYLTGEQLTSLMYELKKIQKKKDGTSLVIQWLGLCASTAGGMGSIPSQGIGIPHASKWGQKKTRKG